jgi:hypothetical protein
LVRWFEIEVWISNILFFNIPLYDQNDVVITK